MDNNNENRLDNFINPSGRKHFWWSDKQATVRQDMYSPHGLYVLQFDIASCPTKRLSMETETKLQDPPHPERTYQLLITPLQEFLYGSIDSWQRGILYSVLFKGAIDIHARIPGRNPWLQKHSSQR